MAYNINIVNGQGSERILNGNYSVTSNTPGYNNSSITPNTVNIVEGTNEYEFKISAEGTLTLHVSEDGTSGGTSVVGATFKRTDSLGNEYGNVITSDTSGNAIFANVPYDSTNAPIIYYKQLSSDGSHTYDSSIKQATLTSQTEIVEVTNALPPVRTITYTDTNYEGLKIDGQINLN